MLPPRIAKPKRSRDGRVRSPKHLRWVRGFACSVPGCAGQPTEAAHVRVGTDGGMGMKPGDQWVISLCSACHNDQHKKGERWFGEWAGLDLIALATEFASKSPDPVIRENAGKR